MEKKIKESDGEFVEVEDGLKKQKSFWYLAGKLILTLYLYFISYFYTLSYPLSWTSPIRLIVIYLAVHYVCEWLGKKKIALLAVSRKMNWKFGFFIFLISVLILGVYYLAYYPGGIIIDSFNQWYQVQKETYVDWHPVIHTLLFMKLPSLICNNLAFVNFVQMLWISAACAYLGMVLERWGALKTGIAATIGVSLLTPASAVVLSFCWKDTALSIFAILLAGQVTEIVCSDGEWLKKWYHILVFSGTGALAMLMRHNGVLLVGPMILLLVVLYWKNVKKYAIMTGIMTLVIVSVIKGPFYRMLHVQNHSQVTAEMLGVPMTILANVLVNEPEALEPECREFMYRIGDQEMWEANYREGSWNSAKWMGDDISNDVIEEEGAERILEYTWHAVQNSPYYAYRAVVKLFEVVWKPVGKQVTWSYHVNIQENNGFGYVTEGNAFLQNVLDKVLDWSVNGGILLTWGWHVGFYLLLLAFAGVSKLKYDLKKCVYWLPVLAYDFGTALLLCGPDFRFFSFNTVVTFPLLLVMMGEKEKGAVYEAD